MKDLASLTKTDIQKLIDCGILKGKDDDRIIFPCAYSDDKEHYMICFDTSREQLEAYKILHASNDVIMTNQSCINLCNYNLLNEALLITPLCIVEDRYGETYSGAAYLAFNMDPYSVSQLDVDAGDMSCRDFWEYDSEDYVIGKGNTPLKALIDLKMKLESQK